MRINKSNFPALPVICLCAMLLILTGSGVAESKTRFSAGFPIDEALENLQTGEAWQYNEMGCVFWPLVYDQLWILGPGPDYNPQPMLAEKWETKDHQTWRFYLNKDAVFHDGKPVTAEDVAFTLWYLPKSHPAWDYPDTDIESRDSINIIDEHTIEFTLASPWGGRYPPVFWTPILPKHIWMPHKRKLVNFKNEEAIGSGPYKLKKFKGGEFIWLEKNEAYWGEKAQVDEVVFKAYGGRDALNLALKKGEVDIIGYNGSSPLSVADFKKSKNIDVAVSPGIGLVWLTFNLHKETAVKDKSVRQAIMYGIDTKRLIAMVYLGYAKPANSFIYPELADYHPDLPDYAYDPDRAKRLLDAAGYLDKDGDGIRNDPGTGTNIKLDFMVPSDWPDEVKLTKIIKEQLKEIGIDINMKVLDLDTYYEFVYTPADDKFDIAISEEEPGPNANWIWEFARSFDNGGDGWNQAYYNNEAFDTLLDGMSSEIDVDKRREMLFKMQEIMADDLPYAVLIRPDLIGPYRTDKFEGHVETMGGLSTWINPWTYFKVKPKK